MTRIQELETQICKTDFGNWQERGKLIKEAFVLSVEVAKTVVPAEKHYIVDQVAETLLQKGTGWFSEKHQDLVITTNDRKEIARYAASWVTMARQAGLKI